VLKKTIYKDWIAKAHQMDWIVGGYLLTKVF